MPEIQGKYPYEDNIGPENDGMTEPVAGVGEKKPDDSRAYRARLPGFIVSEEVGLGDVVKRVTSYFGIQACGACLQRAAALNRRLVFSGGRQRRSGDE